MCFVKCVGAVAPGSGHAAVHSIKSTLFGLVQNIIRSGTLVCWLGRTLLNEDRGVFREPRYVHIMSCMETTIQQNLCVGDKLNKNILSVYFNSSVDCGFVNRDAWKCTRCGIWLIFSSFRDRGVIDTVGERTRTLSAGLASNTANQFRSFPPFNKDCSTEFLFCVGREANLLRRLSVVLLFGEVGVAFLLLFALI